MIVQADFAGNANMDFYKNIAEKVGGKDIGLLVLNAGMGTKGGIEDKKGSEIQPVLDVNIYHVAALMKFLLPMLDKRENHGVELNQGKLKSGIIVVSSIAAVFPSGVGTSGKGNIYSGSKVFCDYLLKAVRYELDKENRNIDCLTLNPGPVHSNMTAAMQNKKWF